MTSTALVIHFSRGVAPVHLAELEQAQALVEVFHDDFTQVANDELLAFGVLEDLEGLVGRRKLLIQQVVDLIVVDLEVAALDNEYALLRSLTLLNLFKKLLQAM